MGIAKVIQQVLAELGRNEERSDPALEEAAHRPTSHWEEVREAVALMT